jgi:hypothetical protein
MKLAQHRHALLAETQMKASLPIAKKEDATLSGRKSVCRVSTEA